MSPERYFATTVPSLALQNATLFSACLACASRVLTAIGELDKAKSDEYEDQAISALIPHLSASDKPQEELYTTAVILRMAEQFSDLQDDMRCHLYGASSLFKSQSDSTYPDVPSFWVYVRQSIRAAFLNEEPCRIDLDSVPCEFTPAPEAVWTDRMTLLLARVCSACWDTSLEEKQRQGMLTELTYLVQFWKDRVPSTFNPWYDSSSENDIFPTIRYVSPWHGELSPAKEERIRM